MSARLAHVIAGVQPMGTVPTVLRGEIDHRVHALGRHQRPVMAGMPRLPTGPPSTLHAAAARPLWAGEAVGRRGLRGHRGILLPQRELALQVLDPLRLLGVLLAEPFILLSQPLDFARRISGRGHDGFRRPWFGRLSLSPPLHGGERTKSRDQVQEA